MKSEIYSLGVLFFELLNPCGERERPRILAGLRHRILPLALLQGRPQVCTLASPRAWLPLAGVVRDACSQQACTSGAICSAAAVQGATGSVQLAQPADAWTL